LLLLPSGPGIRRDSGMYEGWTVPLDYDPLLAKLIGYGSDRAQAMARLQRALYEYFVGGIKTNISLFRRILRHPDFQAGNIDTGFLDRLLADKNYDLTPDETSEANKARVAAIAAGLFSVLQPLAVNGSSKNGTGRTNEADASKWKQVGRQEALRS
jgi:acetyl-CoA carboxylase, biotin carboxylase subunit